MKITFVLLVVLAAVPAFGKSDEVSAPPNRALICFRFKDSALQPPAYTLEIRSDGTGRYTTTYSASLGGAPKPSPVDRVIHVRGALLGRLFEAADKAHFFTVPCADRRHPVAYSGTKTFSYSGPGGEGNCTFNYAKEPAVNQAADALRAVAYTLNIGERLALEQRYQPLALDSELIALREAVADGEALEVANIAPELSSIAADGAALERDRAYARTLLRAAASHR